MEIGICIVATFLYQFNILLCIERSHCFSQILPSYISVILNTYLSFFALFGRYQDYSISSSRSINSRGCRIFQYINSLNVGWIQHVNISTGHAIYHVQRFRIINCSKSTYNDFKAITRFSALLCNVYARSLTLQRTKCTNRIHFRNIFSFHLNSRTCYQPFLLYTITDYYHFIQNLIIGIKFYFKIRLLFYVYRFCLISQIRDLKTCAIINSERKLSIQISNCTVIRTLFFYIGTNQCFPVPINNTCNNS